jgi:hypothetical protein
MKNLKLLLGLIFEMNKKCMHSNENPIYEKGIARPQPQFPHSCVCERFIYSQDRSTYFPQQNMQTDRVEIGTEDPFPTKGSYGNVSYKRIIV